MIGNVVLLASTLFFFLGPAPGYILAARALQGAAGASLYISGLAFLISRIDPPEAIGFYMGYMTLAQTMGELVGPLMGGSLYQYVGHWAVFGATEGIIAVDMILRLLIREPKKGEPMNMRKRETTIASMDMFLIRKKGSGCTMRMMGHVHLRRAGAEERWNSFKTTTERPLERPQLRIVFPRMTPIMMMAPKPWQFSRTSDRTRY